MEARICPLGKLLLSSFRAPQLMARQDNGQGWVPLGDGMGCQPCPAHQQCVTHQPRSWPCASLLPELFSGINGLCLNYFHTETDVGKQGPYKNPIFSFLFSMLPVGGFFLEYIIFSFPFLRSYFINKCWEIIQFIGHCSFGLDFLF